MKTQKTTSKDMKRAMKTPKTTSKDMKRSTKIHYSSPSTHQKLARIASRRFFALEAPSCGSVSTWYVLQTGHTGVSHMSGRRAKDTGRLTRCCLVSRTRCCSNLPLLRIAGGSKREWCSTEPRRATLPAGDSAIGWADLRRTASSARSCTQQH